MQQTNVQYQDFLVTTDHVHFLVTMLTGRGNLEVELLLPSMPVFEVVREVLLLLGELGLAEWSGFAFLTILCTSLNWTGFNGESRVAVLGGV